MTRNASRVAVALVVLSAATAGLLAAGRGRGGITAPDGSKPGKQWLFVIGINKYQNWRVWPELDSAVADAQAVRDVLTERYRVDKVVELYDAQATRNAICEKLRQLAINTSKNDSVLIYYAGHGQLDTVERMGSWVPVGGTRDPFTWVGNDRIKRYVGNMGAKHVLLISDSCFAGDFFREREGIPQIDEPYYRRAYGLASRQAMTSGGVEPVADAALRGHSPFAYWLLDALRTNSKRYLVPSELFDRIKEGVARNSRQTPQVGYLQGACDAGGEFIFFLKPADKRPEAGELVVRSEPSGAEIFFSTMDKSYGRTPKTFTAQPGAYDIILRFANGQTWRGQATIDGPGDRKEVVGRPPEKPVVVAPRPQPAARPKPASARPGDVRTNPTDGAEMVWIPAGQFLMGADRADNERIFDKFGWPKEYIDKYAKDEAPKHRVRLDGFWMYKYEVTARQFGKFVEATGYRTDAEKEGWSWWWNVSESKAEKVKDLSWRFPFKKGERARPDHPVVQVSWNDAQAYCRWAGVRLPTEAEWEYAARGGDTGLGGKPHHAFVWGNDAPSKAVANFWDESAVRKWGDKYLKFPNYDDGYALTAPVGAYAANEFGLFDMAGNVWEWCQDWYDEGYYARSETNNPTGATTGTHRVVRGGAWLNTPVLLRVSFRNWFTPVYRNSNLGFRCARTP